MVPPGTKDNGEDEAVLGPRLPIPCQNRLEGLPNFGIIKSTGNPLTVFPGKTDGVILEHLDLNEGSPVCEDRALGPLGKELAVWFGTGQDGKQALGEDLLLDLGPILITIKEERDLPTSRYGDKLRLVLRRTQAQG